VLVAPSDNTRAAKALDALMLKTEKTDNDDVAVILTAPLRCVIEAGNVNAGYPVPNPFALNVTGMFAVASAEVVDALFLHAVTLPEINVNVLESAASCHTWHPGIVRGSNPEYCWAENIVTTAEEFQPLRARQPA
jgi:hypothetical protein